MANSSLGDETLAFRRDFQSALAGISRSTFIRYEKQKVIPEPDAFIGRQKAWRLSTIRATVEKLVSDKGSNRPACDIPRSTGRPRKITAAKSANSQVEQAGVAQ